jgi:hypothetical protein
MARFSGSPFCSFTNSWRERLHLLALLKLEIDFFVEPLHLRERILRQGLLVQLAFPAHNQFAELCAPIANMIVSNHLVPKQPENAVERVTENGRADMAHVHGLGDVRRAEIDDDGARLRRGAIKEVLARMRGLERGGDRFALEPKVQETRAGDLHRAAPRGNIEPGEDILSKLARVKLPFLGESHQRIALVIAELRVARTHLHG